MWREHVVAWSNGRETLTKSTPREIGKPQNTDSAGVSSAVFLSCGASELISVSLVAGVAPACSTIRLPPVHKYNTRPEKAISLHPLTIGEALSAALQIKLADLKRLEKAYKAKRAAKESITKSR